MVHGVKGFLQVQEDHPSELTSIHVFIYDIQQMQYTCASGVVLPEPELSLRQQVVITYMIIQLRMNNSVYSGNRERFI